MQRLRKKLSPLPSGEIDSAVQYYEEYFDEAGTENEPAIIDELGPPEKVASMIKVNHAVNDIKKSDGSAKKSLKAIFIVILAIFASPIAIPIGIAVFAVILSLVIALLAVFISLLAAGVGVAAGGLLSIIAAVVVLAQSPATFVFYAGFGLTSIAVGVALFMSVAYISKICFRWIANMASKLVVGRRGK